MGLGLAINWCFDTRTFSPPSTGVLNLNIFVGFLGWKTTLPKLRSEKKDSHGNGNKSSHDMWELPVWGTYQFEAKRLKSWRFSMQLSSFVRQKIPKYDDSYRNSAISWPSSMNIIWSIIRSTNIYICIYIYTYVYQVIQSDLLIPRSLNLSKRSLNHPKMVTKKCQVCNGMYI